MNLQPTRVPYRQTKAYSKIVLDYIDQAEELRPFYQHAPSFLGILNAIDARQSFPTNRKVLVEELRKQYENINTSDRVRDNIDRLSNDNCFTITTAHQNNLFTGPLYFIYKIIHAIKLADQLNEVVKEKEFVPIFYIGSEDADLEELNHIYLGNEKLVWDTSQTGAVGRMKVDKKLLSLIDRMEGELSVLPFGVEMAGKLRNFYREGNSIEQSTFELVNDLFASYGLVVLMPDNKALKATMKDIFRDDLLHQTASAIVEETARKLGDSGYKVQANPRQINLFYLEGNKRERIERKKDQYTVLNTPHSFSEPGLLNELESNPEKFSPNVILRGLYQETILPDIAFIGGGGETAYWLQLKALFETYHVPFPVLVLRNSFMIVERRLNEKINRLGFSSEDLFKGEQDLMEDLVRRESANPVQLNGAIDNVRQLYESFKQQAAAIDPSLVIHVDALKAGVLHKLIELEKKMLRAEKRKFNDHNRQLRSILGQLFPNKGLQERQDNIAYYFSKWGNAFIDSIYDACLGLEQEFVILEEKEG